MAKNDLVRRSIIIMVVMILQACQGAAETLPPTPTTPPSADSGESVTPTIPIVAALPADFNLSGKLILSDYNTGISEFDFSTKTMVSKFHPPNNGFVGSTVLSPDSKTFLMIYSIPRDIGDPQYGAADLYTLSADGSGEPKLLLNTTQSGDYYFSPWWAPDGQSIYYGRLYTPISGTPTKPTGYFLVHYALPGGPPQDLITDILGVRISANGKKLFYISFDQQTTLSNIYEADLDGTNAKSLLPEKETWIIDSIGISPDGQSVIFNRGMPATSQSGFSLLYELMGVHVASAHNLPSDIWIAKSGVTPKQLSHLNGYGFVADFSPDGQFIAFSCDTGVYVMRADGTEQTKISNVSSFSMIQWAS
jgi:hypothetical protein